MQISQSYIGFPPLPKKSDIINALLNDPPDTHWQIPRQLFRIANRQDREELIEALQPLLYQVDDVRIKQRLFLALQALHRPLSIETYVLVHKKGVFKPSELENGDDLAKVTSPIPNFFPVIDGHVHPKSPDLKFLADMREAGICLGVIVATDTDPADVDRPEIRRQLEQAYAGTAQSDRMPFDSLLKHIRSNLYSSTHVTNQDVFDWVSDYPDHLVGFGSVNLSKGRDYVERTLEGLGKMGLKGLNLLPHAQFFNPSENENMDLVADYCRMTGAIISSYTGCGAGPFEIPELSQHAHPTLWEPFLTKYQDVRLVLSHFGAYSKEIPGIWLFEAAQMGTKFRNVYADLAGVDWLLDRENVVQEIRKTIGFDRVLFATDYPHCLASGGSWAHSVSSIKANTHLTPKEKRKVLGNNAAHLLGIN
jgi:predicted TIM-barrel fold metal-dependent hydrolase